MCLVISWNSDNEALAYKTERIIEQSQLWL